MLSAWRIALGALCCTAAASVSTSSAQEVPGSLERWVDSAVVESMTGDRIPGAAVALVRDGRIALAKGYGLADVTEDRPVTADGTIFRIGSVSKVLTALALTRLIDRGEVDLDTPIGRYLSGDEATALNDQPIVVRHLLTHTAGFDQTGLGRKAEDPSTRPTLAAFVRDELRPIREPGVVAVYDTYGISLAGLLLERISGLPFAEHMRRHVFAPLGMHDSWVEVPDRDRERLATGYGLEEGELVPQPYEWYVTLPASSIDATVMDMARLLRALLGQGAALLSPEMAERVRSERLFSYGDMGAFSWGFWEEKREGYRALHHGGVMFGYSSELYMVPEAGIGFFVAYNRDFETGPPARLREAMTDLLYDRFLPERAGREPPSVPTVRVDGDRFAGAYGSTVACYTCEEGDGWPISTLTVSAEEPGILSLYGGRARFLAEQELVFRSAARGSEIRFLQDSSGDVRYLVQGPNSFVKLDDSLLTRVLGTGWAERPAHPLVARVRFANEEWPEAARAYGELAEQDPENGRYHFNRGFSLLEAGRFREAETAFRRALEIGRWEAWSQYYVAAALIGAGETERAWEALEAALDMGFDDVGLLRSERWWEEHRDAPEYHGVIERLED